MAALIARLPLTEKQGKILYDAISNRFQHKTCFKCLKIKCILEGVYSYPGGDMSKPKHFICGACK